LTVQCVVSSDVTNVSVPVNVGGVVVVRSAEIVTGGFLGVLAEPAQCPEKS